MLQNAQLARTINDVHTDVVLQAFADRIIVLVTQVGKVGNLVSSPHLVRRPGRRHRVCLDSDRPWYRASVQFL